MVQESKRNQDSPQKDNMAQGEKQRLEGQEQEQGEDISKQDVLQGMGEGIDKEEEEE